MGFVSNTVRFSTGTGAIGTLIDVPLPRLGAANLAPQVLRARIIGRTDTSDAAGLASHRIGYGFAVSPSSQRCEGAFCANGGGSSVANNFHLTDCILASSDSSHALNGKLGVNSMSSVGTVQFIILQQFASSLTVELSAWAGDISNASIVDASLQSNGDFLIAAGHPARYVESLYPVAFSLNAVSNVSGGTFGLGRTYIPDGVNQVINLRSNHGVNPSVTSRYAYSGECIQSNNGSGGGGVRARITASAPTGFTLQVIGSVAGSNYNNVSFLVVDGTFQCKLGETTTETGSSVSLIDPGFVSEHTDVWSHCAVKSTQFVMQAGAEISLGWFNGQFGADQHAMAANSVNGVSPMVVGTAIDFNSVYLNLDGAGALSGEGGVIAPNVPSTPTTSSLQYSNPDTTANYLTWAAFAPAEISSTGYVKDVVSNSLGSGTATIEFSNLAAAGLIPKYLKVYTTGVALGTQTVETVGQHIDPICYGWALPDGTQVCYALVEDNVTNAPSMTCARGRANFVLIEADSAGNVIASLTASGFAVGEATLTVTGTPNADIRYIIEAIGGTNISSVTLTPQTRASGAGANTWDTGNESRYVEVLDVGLAAGVDGAVGNAVLSVGRCWVPDLTNQVMAWASEDGVGTSNTGSYGYEGECIGLPSPTGGTSLGTRGSITAGSATGITFTAAESAATCQVHVLSVAGTFDGRLGNVATRTDQAAINFAHGIATPVKALDAWSICAAQSTQDVTTAGAQASIGSCVTPNVEPHARCLSRHSVDNVAGGLVASGASMVDLYQNLDAAGAIEGEMQAVTDAGLYMRDPDSGVFVMLAAFGDGITPGGGSTHPQARSLFNRTFARY